MKKFLLATASTILTVGALSAKEIVSTNAYKWVGDTIMQGEFMAFAPSDFEIVSNYSAQPGYFMPVGKQWKLQNDISDYPRLRSSNRLHNAIYNMGLDEMINNVEPDTTLRTGKEWAGVWTRDVSYSIILSMAYMQPEASKISLMRKVTPEGRIIQDTGSGGAWPVSSDRMIWAVAAYELYKVTGDREWLEYIYPIIKNSLEDDFNVIYVDGGVNGETSFIDWREQSYPKWMQPVDIYNSQAQNTGAVHVAALDVLAKIADELGNQQDAKKYKAMSEGLNKNLKEKFAIEDSGLLAMYSYGREYPIVLPRTETLGQSVAILFDQLSPEQARQITERHPVTDFGAPIFFPQIKDMPAYHNNALWPFVASYWTLANATVGNEQGTLEGIGSVFRPAALFATNKENLNLDNGDIATELNSSNMLWSLSGNIAITVRVLFGIHFEADGLLFKPFVPKALADSRTLEGFHYRDAVLNVTVNGFGSEIKSFTVNGRQQARPFIPADARGTYNIVIDMADNSPEPMTVNRVANVKAPLTPIARIGNNPALNGEDIPYLNELQWNPLEYIARYIILRDGQRIAETRTTTWPATVPGEYQVIGVDSNGVESFASEPMSNRLVELISPAAEVVEMSSPEVSYPATTSISGYHGNGFIEVDQQTAPVVFDFTVKPGKAGKYSLSLRYANGNGPINTENKAAIRTLLIDGKKAGTVVMPQRGVGNWDDWGMSNSVKADLSEGNHTVAIVFEPYDQNMNGATNHALIDELVITPLN